MSSSATQFANAKIHNQIGKLQKILEDRNASDKFDIKEKIKGVVALVFGVFAVFFGLDRSLGSIPRLFSQAPMPSPLSLAAGPTIGILLFGGACVYAYNRFTLPTNKEIQSKIQELQVQLKP